MQDTEQTRIFKGVSQDTHPGNQPEGTARFLLNTVNESIEGDMGSVSNERGTEQCWELPEGYSLIGRISLPDNGHCMFLAPTTADQDSKIWIVDTNCQITEVLSEVCLNFSPRNPIKGFSRVREGCQRTVYFIDPNSNNEQRNPPRIIDLDDIINHPTNHQYLTSGVFDCSKVKWFRDMNVPNITLSNILVGGGSLPLGTYQFALQYTDTDLNGTAFIALSPIIPITNGQGSYDNIDGGTSLLFPPTSKAIELALTNLDTAYSYYRIAVIETNGGSGQPAAYFLSSPQPFNGTTATFVYGSPNAATYSPTTLENILIPSLSFSFLDLLQLDNRAFVAYTKEPEVDLAAFQIKALEYQAKYVTKLIERTSLNDGPKSGGFYATSMSFLRDEVYEPAIVWVMNDGYELPPIPLIPRKSGLKADGTSISIPAEDALDLAGRHNREAGSVAGGWDTGSYTVNTNITNLTAPADAQRYLNYVHLTGSRGITSGTNFTIPRWEVYNTAIRTDGPTYATDGTYHTKGEFAYFEADYTYPNTQDCNGNFIFGEAGENQEQVRLFKFPDTTLEPSFYNPGPAYVIPIGFEFSNINPPAAYASDVQGYKIVVTVRDAQNRTVIDKGIFYHNWIADNSGDPVQFQSPGAGSGNRWVTSGRVPVQQGSTTYTSTGAGYASNNSITLFGIPDYKESYTLSFHGPAYKFNHAAEGATYFKLEQIYDSTVFVYGGASLADVDVREVTQYGGFVIPGVNHTNRNITASAYIEPDTVLPQGILSTDFYNGSQQEAFVVETTQIPLNFTAAVDFPPPIHGLNKDTSGDPITVEGAQYNHAYYGSMKRLNYSIYGSIAGMRFRDTNGQMYTGTSVQVYGGDTFISQLTFRKTMNLDDADTGDTNGPYTERHSIEFIAESTINSELRHAGDTTLGGTGNSCDQGSVQKYAPKYYNSTLDNLYNDDGDWLMLDYCHTNYYAYNPDYSNLPDEKVYYSLPLNFDYCLVCKNEHPFRVHHSKKSTQEETIDSYRIFLANDYKDFPGDKGSITSIFPHRNDIYIRTTNTTYQQLVSPVQIETSFSPAQLGTGTPLGNPEREVITADNGYMGGISRFSIINTPYGTLIPDEVQGRIYLLTASPEEISNKGLRNWFEENLPFFLPKQLQDNSLPLDAFVNSIGVFTTYDDRHKRLIICKRDFELADITQYVAQEDITTNDLGKITFINGYPFLLTYYVTTPVYQTLAFDNPLYFRNKSWTVSYSFLNDSWMGWHSYLPNFLYSDSNTFYSWKNTSTFAWKHNYGEYQNYYGTKRDHIVELSIPTPSTKQTHDITYMSKAFLYDTSKEHFYQVPFTTYDRILSYNDIQSTGIRTLDVTNTNIYPTYSSTVATVTKTNEHWTVNELWDTANVKTVPLFNSSWTALSSSYYIDKVPNSLAHTTDDYYNQSRLQDKWCNIRLYSNNTQNIKLVTDILSTLTYQVPR